MNDMLLNLLQSGSHNLQKHLFMVVPFPLDIVTLFFGIESFELRYDYFYKFFY